jgi:phosphatidate phosphatase PAH1
MNYIRGAVNVISAPYQYYKDLPPINPSTLTGAIDVIVIQRPTDNGHTELVCSPFHVRFGKWQVLRPGEKKVRPFLAFIAQFELKNHSTGQRIRQWSSYSIQYEDRRGWRSFLRLRDG